MALSYPVPAYIESCVAAFVQFVIQLEVPRLHQPVSDQAATQKSQNITARRAICHRGWHDCFLAVPSRHGVFLRLLHSYTQDPTNEKIQQYY